MTRPDRTNPPVCTCGAKLPEYADRNTLANIISSRFFPVTARTIRTWPLTVSHPNKKAVHPVAEALAYAEKKLKSSPSYKQEGR
jgi:hypothetical protein